MVARSATLEEFRAELVRQKRPVDALNVEDLFLVHRALAREAFAVAEVDRRIRIACAKARLGGTLEADELVQRVRERLLVGSALGLAAYRGKGALLSWLRAVVATTVIDLQRGAGPAAADSDDAALEAATGRGADLQLAGLENQRAFTRAFKAAVAALPPRERTVLRMRYADQANLDEIARLYKVHRTTVMRWLETAHAQVLEATRRELAAALGVRGRALDSVMRSADLSFAERVSQLLAR